MISRSRMLGVGTALLAILLGTPAVAPSSASSASSAPLVKSSRSAVRGGTECLIDVFGQTGDGRLHFRRVVNDRVQVSKTTAGAVGWHPVTWGIRSMNRWPGYESTTQLVVATNGTAHFVETEWTTGGGLKLSSDKVVGRGLPGRRIFSTGRSLVWVAADHSLRTRRWNGTRFSRVRVLPIELRHVRAMTGTGTDDGVRVYYADRDGALHLVRRGNTGWSDQVLKESGYGSVTALRDGGCISSDHVHVRPARGLLSVDRRSGVARFQRVMHPNSEHGVEMSPFQRVRPSDWTWRQLG